MSHFDGYVSRIVVLKEDDLRVLNGKDTKNPFSAMNGSLSVRTRNCYAFAYGCPPVNKAEIDDLRKKGIRPGSVLEAFLPAPGTMGGRRFDSFKVEEIKGALIRDGFEFLSMKPVKEINISGARHLIAAFFYINKFGDGDYHFYRHHPESGTWFHKTGWHDPVENFDHAGRVIVDVMKSDNGKYNAFAGFYLSPRQPASMNAFLMKNDGQFLTGQKPRRKTFGDRVRMMISAFSR